MHPPSTTIELETEQHLMKERQGVYRVKLADIQARELPSEASIRRAFSAERCAR
jgi:hypothetical protein